MAVHSLGLNRRTFIAFLALGTVSLFADWTYEGARSVLGPYMSYLGATAFIVGIASAGDLLGYLMRGVGGFIAHKSRSSKVYWSLVFGGYCINLLAVPALALAGNWEAALALVLLERMGKGLRTPARDTILAEVTEGMGKGKGFGLHELMDQVGAVAGPAFVTWSLISTDTNYRVTYELLAIPAFIALTLIFVAFISHPRVASVEAEAEGKGILGRNFWLYTGSMMLLSLGFMHWLLAGYVMRAAGLPASYVGLSYLLAMLADAAIALPAGILYDKYGPKTLALAPALAALAGVMFVGGGGLQTVFTAAIVWGVVMGLYETNMRVTVSDVVPSNLRAYAYGVYGAAYGLSWTAGNALMGLMYSFTPSLIIPYILMTEAASIAVLVTFLKTYTSTWKK